MRCFTLFFTIVTVVGCYGNVIKNSRKFPDDFLFGTATASYQIEGAWNEDDKGESIWDHMTHTNPTVIKDVTNGDIAADSYHNYKRDVEMMRELGLDAYRFSLSWSRILPTGFANQVSNAGIAYYSNLIDEMLKYNIIPMVTLYHWDLPQKLQVLGGWTNLEIVDWFGDYARVVYEHLGDKVKHWITINEPREICYEGYGTVTKAPRVNATGIGEYLCAKNLVMAHANAYRIYNDNFKSIQGGQCGITISVNWFGAATESDEDMRAAELRRQSEWGMYAEPIFSENGGFPKELIEKVAEKSAAQGYIKSRLPEFTEDEKKFVQGTSDFFGVNHYTAYIVSAGEANGMYPVPSLLDDIEGKTTVPEEWPKSQSQWLTLAPNSLNNALTHLNEKYNAPTFYITESGWSTIPGLDDDLRINYFRSVLESALDVLDKGIVLKGYMAWSLMDNFEWMEGYVERFGLYEVDFEDPARTRIPRKSAFVYKEILKSRSIDHDYKPNIEIMTIDEGN